MASILFKFFSTVLNIQALLLDTIPIQINYWYYTLIFVLKRGWDKSPSLSIIFGLSSKTQWLSGLYYADFISFYSPTQLCGGGTTKSNSNELPISVPLSDSILT